MKLPKVVIPEIVDTLPLSKKKVTFRPFLVAEEKILLMAMEGYNQTNNVEVLIDGIKRIIKNCILSNNIDVDELPNLDVEWLFMKIRMKSIGETVELTMVHDVEGCGEENKVSVRLSATQMHIPEVDPKIALSDTAGVVLRYPRMGTSLNLVKTNPSDGAAIIYSMIADCIDSVYDGDDFAKGSEFPREDLISWIETWTPEQFKKATDFIDKLPYMKTEIKYKCSKCKADVTTEVRGSPDFFT